MQLKIEVSPHIKLLSFVHDRFMKAELNEIYVIENLTDLLNRDEQAMKLLKIHC